VSPVGLSSGGVLLVCLLRCCCNVVRFDDGFCPVGLVALLVAAAGVAAGAAGCVERVVAHGGFKVLVGASLALRVDGCAARVTSIQDLVLRLVGVLVMLIVCNCCYDVRVACRVGCVTLRIDSVVNPCGYCPRGQILPCFLFMVRVVVMLLMLLLVRLKSLIAFVVLVVPRDF
jgi:hypothetical protein